MKLSDLVYQVVKQAVYFENNNELSKEDILNYANALTTDINNIQGKSISSDYKRNLDNAIFVINNAIQRLANLDKLPLDILETPYKEIVDIDPSEINHIISVFKQNESDYEVIPFNTLGRKKIRLNKKVNGNICIEYQREIPFFDLSDIVEDIDLSEYGINNLMCSYIILWCKGTLGRDIYGVEADRWVNQAESYFLDLEVYGGYTPHYQANLSSDYWSMNK